MDDEPGLFLIIVAMCVGVAASWLQHHLRRKRRQREEQDKPQKWGRGPE